VPGTVLNAVGWDHPRCMRPMRAAAAAWKRLRPEVTITWTARPLEAFNDEPLEELARRFDLLVIDHPFVGTAERTGCLVPLDDLLPRATIETRAADAVGPSHASYVYGGCQWALAVDAACQVGAVRDDLLDTGGWGAPETWEEVRTLARALPGRVALPLYPTDAICSLLSVLGGLGVVAPGEASFFPDAAAGAEAFGLLSQLVPFLHDESFGLNPPKALERMTRTDEIVAIPLLFGYTNYARPGGADAGVRFLDVPSSGLGPVGSLLGGAGLAVSAHSPAADDAAAFAAWICGAHAQRELVFPEAGQPASRSVWADPLLDAAAGGFFSGTTASIEAAHVRPRDPWWPGFQEEAGAAVAGVLRQGVRPTAAVELIEGLYDRHHDVVETRR
jgi:multiple sugar transport system substrate-binding protein